MFFFSKKCFLNLTIHFSEGKSVKTLGRYSKSSSSSNFLPNLKNRGIEILSRAGSLSENEGVDSILDNQARLIRIRDQLFESFNDTYKSVREEVAVTNRDNMFLMMVNFIGGMLFFLFDCTKGMKASFWGLLRLIQGNLIFKK